MEDLKSAGGRLTLRERHLDCPDPQVFMITVVIDTEASHNKGAIHSRPLGFRSVHYPPRECFMSKMGFSF